MSAQILDWSKYGRPPPPASVEYSERGGRIHCYAAFTTEQWEEVKKRIDAQVEFWKQGDKNNGNN